MSIANLKKDGIPICLTGILFIVAIVFLSFPEGIQGTNLWIDVIFFAVLNVGFLVALIWGTRTKNKPIVLFSLLVNSSLFIIGMLFIFTYLIVIITT